MSNSKFNYLETLQTLSIKFNNDLISESIDCYFQQVLQQLKDKLGELMSGIRDPEKLDVTFNGCSSVEEKVELIEQTLNIWGFVYECFTAERFGFFNFIEEKTKIGDENKVDLNESYLKPRLESVSEMIKAKISAINILASGEKLSEDQLNVIEKYDQEIKSWTVDHKAFKTKRILSDDMLKKIESFDCDIATWKIYRNSVEMKEDLPDDVKEQIEKYNQEIKWWSIYKICLENEQADMPVFIEQRAEYLRRLRKLLIKYGDSVIYKL